MKTPYGATSRRLWKRPGCRRGRQGHLRWPRLATPCTNGRPPLFKCEASLKGQWCACGKQTQNLHVQCFPRTAHLAAHSQPTDEASLVCACCAAKLTLCWQARSSSRCSWAARQDVDDACDRASWPLVLHTGMQAHSWPWQDGLWRARASSESCLPQPTVCQVTALRHARRQLMEGSNVA